MKALTIRQPYADAIFRGWKPYEIRTWRTSFRGEFVVHAAAKRAEGLGDWRVINSIYAPFHITDLPRGIGLGVVRLVDCVPYAEIESSLLIIPKAFCPYGKWAWQIEVVERWQTPIPAKGKLGFWNWI